MTLYCNNKTERVLQVTIKAKHYNLVFVLVKAEACLIETQRKI